MTASDALRGSSQAERPAGQASSEKELVPEQKANNLDPGLQSEDKSKEPDSPNARHNDMLDTLDAFVLPFMLPTSSVSPQPRHPAPETVSPRTELPAELPPSASTTELPTALPAPTITQDQDQTSLPPPSVLPSSYGTNATSQGLIPASSPIPFDQGLCMVPNGSNMLPEVIPQQKVGPPLAAEGLQPVYTTFDRAPEPIVPNAAPVILGPRPTVHDIDAASVTSISQPKRPSITAEWSKASSGLMTATSKTYLATKIATKMAIQESSHMVTKPVKTSTDYMNKTLKDSTALVDKVIGGSATGLKRMLTFPTKDSKSSNEWKNIEPMQGARDIKGEDTNNHLDNFQGVGVVYSTQQSQATSTTIETRVSEKAPRIDEPSYFQNATDESFTRAFSNLPNSPNTEDVAPPSYDFVTPSSTASTPSTISKLSYAPFSPDDINPRGKVQRKPLPPTHSASFDSLNTPLNPRRSMISSTVVDGEMHDIWTSLVAEEENFVDRLAKFKRVFYDAIVEQWPELEKDLGAVAMGGQFIALHNEHLLSPMRVQVPKTESFTCDPAIFDGWIAHAYKLYREYSQRFPQSERSLRHTASGDDRFSSLIASLGLSIIWFGKSWEQYLRLPLIQLSIYVDTLEKLVLRAQILDETAGTKDAAPLQRTLQSVQTLRDDCVRLADEAQRQEEIQDLHRRIRAVESAFVSNINLSDPNRRIIFEGALAFKANGHGAWQPIYAILLDNYIVWGKDKPPALWKAQTLDKKTNNMWVYEVPIYAPHLEYTIPKDKNEKSGFMDDIPRGQKLFPMTVKDKHSSFKPHSFAAFSVYERQDWVRHFDQVKEGSP
ncbi:hypothetical protein B0J11DRAFT_581355 [Dendryphion nanum]|uniref:PH domain-containing protein n=1 Tax=Dendryphion nanum TaxID=256645 RepID=A0A9P9DPE4_9PLEO|nr:hypothetical protein B0J11DRAFT_581355 [Dendryphion nanum]